MAANWETLGHTMDQGEDYTYVDMDGLVEDPSMEEYGNWRASKKKIVYNKKTSTKSKARRAAAHKRALWSVYQDDDYTRKLHKEVANAADDTHQWVQHDDESTEAWEWLAKNHKRSLEDMQARDEDLHNYLEWKYDNDATFKARTDKMAANWETLGNTLDQGEDFTYVDMDGLVQEEQIMAYKKKVAKKNYKKKAHKKAMWMVYMDDEYTKRVHADLETSVDGTMEWVEENHKDPEMVEVGEWYKGKQTDSWNEMGANEEIIGQYLENRYNTDEDFKSHTDFVEGKWNNVADIASQGDQYTETDFSGLDMA